MAPKIHKQSSRLFLLPAGLALVDIAFQKGASDPLNPIKLWVLGILASWALAEIVSTPGTRLLIKKSRVIKYFTLILLFFIGSFFTALILTPVLSIGLLGDTGRNIGFLNYIFLAVIALYSGTKISFVNIKDIYWTAFLLSGIFSVYGFFQHFKIDFLKWNTPYNPIILTVGNPDFASSLLSLFAVLCFGGFFIKIHRSIKFFLFPLIVLTLIIIYWTQARQGLIETAVGIGLVIVVLVWQRNIKLALSLILIEFLFGLVSILGMLQIGPLTKLLYKASVNDRGYNWRAALNMFKHHPWFGVGVDRYAAFFLQYRSPKYPLIYGYTQTVTNAHNVFLQILATAGIFAGLSYVILIVFIAKRAWVALHKTTGTDQVLIAGIVAGWIVFVAQSIISVDSLSISIWGWILGGAIIALSIQDEVSKNLKPISSSRGIVFIAASLSFLFIIIPMYRNERATDRFSRITAPSDPSLKNIYRNIARSTFNQALLNPNYKNNIALILAKNNYNSEAIADFREVIKEDPRNTNAYSLLATLYETMKDSKSAIPYRQALSKLDPYGAENLVSLEADYLFIGDKHAAIITRDVIIAIAPGTDVAKRAANLITK